MDNIYKVIKLNDLPPVGDCLMQVQNKNQTSQEVMLAACKGCSSGHPLAK